MKETAIRMIQEIPDDKIIHVLHFLKGIHGLYEDSGVADTQKQAALRRLRQMRGRIPADLNYDEELSKSRTERYAHTR
jgi:hypothetical protein